MNKYKNTGAELYARRVVLNIKKMTTELNEHRYYLERNVARRTEHLLKRIDLLESCNAALCSKLALSQGELAALQRAPQNTKPDDNSAKLYLLNSQADVQEKRTVAA